MPKSQVSDECEWVILRYMEVLTSTVSKCDLIWRQELYRGHWVKMRSLGGGALTQYDECPYKMRIFGHEEETHRERENAMCG